VYVIFDDIHTDVGTVRNSN